MRLIPEVSAAECKAFLDATNYPCDWDQDLLARYCLLTRIEAPCGSAAGYIWFHWVKDADRVLDFHIAIHPQFQRRLTRSVGVDILILARATGARTLLARPISSDHAALLLRLGFSLHGPFAVLSLNPLDESLHPFVARAVLARERKTHGQAGSTSREVCR